MLTKTKTKENGGIITAITAAHQLSISHPDQARSLYHKSAFKLSQPLLFRNDPFSSNSPKRFSSSPPP